MGSDHIVLTLQLLSGSSAYAVDVGQMTRGYRYMYRPIAGLKEAMPVRTVPHGHSIPRRMY